ncbi:MAG: carboxypeptidase-like regulatory domain-containing protein [Nitrososphaerales archaeon]|jgi:hypothetical protein
MNDTTMGKNEIMETGEGNEAKPDEQLDPEQTVGSIEGHVVCSTGPVRYALVHLGTESAETDYNGNFLLENLPPGTATLSVKSPSPRLNSSAIEVEVKAGKQSCEVSLEEWRTTLEGSITDKNGNPIENAEVYGRLKPMDEPLSTRSDGRGHYVLKGIPWGTYYFLAKASGYMSEGVTIQVQNDKPIPKNFNLNSAGLSIGGKVLSTEGKPIDAEITLLRNFVVVGSTKVSASSDGSYSFVDLAPDDYTMALVTPGYTPKGWYGTLEKPEVVNFSLPKAVLHWKFKEANSGQALSNAKKETNQLPEFPEGRTDKSA